MNNIIFTYNGVDILKDEEVVLDLKTVIDLENSLFYFSNNEDENLLLDKVGRNVSYLFVYGMAGLTGAAITLYMQNSNPFALLLTAMGSFGTYASAKYAFLNSMAVKKRKVDLAQFEEVHSKLREKLDLEGRIKNLKEIPADNFQAIIDYTQKFNDYYEKAERRFKIFAITNTILATGSFVLTANLGAINNEPLMVGLSLTTFILGAFFSREAVNDIKDHSKVKRKLKQIPKLNLQNKQ